MQFCLIDPDASFRQILRYHLEIEWPDVSIVEFEHATATAPSSATLADCDAVLLACPLPGRQGLAGIEHFFERGAYPPVLLFATAGDELLAVDALKAGAASYFPKQLLTHRRLIETLRTELGSVQRPGSATLTGNHGQYRFVGELHSTAVATVYLAEPVSGGERLAVKLIRYVPDAGSERLFDRYSH
jgi:DNA-binding NarL/FixJ family response regulator